MTFEFKHTLEIFSLKKSRGLFNYSSLSNIDIMGKKSMETCFKAPETLLNQAIFYKVVT